MDGLNVLFIAFQEVMNPTSLLWIAIGTVVGIVFGAAPGLTATTGIALFTPVTFSMPFETSFAFLLAIYCGGYYAGSIPAILIRTPGAPGNAATCLDGHPMASQGKAGLALGYSVISSWIGGTLSTIVLFFFAPIIGAFALRFGPAEYFSISVLGLTCIASISSNSILKGVIAATIGMMLGLVGMDPIAGIERFTFGSVDMMGGVALIPALVALFAITEALKKVDSIAREKEEPISQVTKVLPELSIFFKAKWLILKSAFIGIIIGAIPGTGPTIASWMSYNEAKRTSATPEKFGNGSEEGIMACETANNAVTGGALIPLITLGIPGDGVTAVLLGALMIQGLTPGPMLLTEKFDLVAVFLWILLIANLFMLIFGLLGSRLFPMILRMPMQILVPVIVMLCIAGSYASNNSYFDVQMTVFLGLFGFILMKLQFEPAPIVLGYILGPIIEPNFRLALMSSNMDYLIFVKQPLSLFFLLVTLAFIVFMVISKKKQQATTCS